MVQQDPLKEKLLEVAKKRYGSEFKDILDAGGQCFVPHEGNAYWVDPRTGNYKSASPG